MLKRNELLKAVFEYGTVRMEGEGNVRAFRLAKKLEAEGLVKVWGTSEFGWITRTEKLVTLATENTI